VAARGECAAAGDAGDWIPQQRVARPLAQFVSAFHRGLNETGYVEGKNVIIEYRWARGQYDRLREMAADLVGRRVAVIVTTGASPSLLAARSATREIPTVLIAGEASRVHIVARRRGSSASTTNSLKL